jgi:DNA primase
MSLYTKESIERVRAAVDMVDLVQAKTELRRAGAEFMGLCPFHEERTPSFHVNAAEKVFFCFGCGEKGDLFQFVRLAEGASFREAVELLADRYGVKLELEDEDPRAAEKRKERGRLIELLERTAAWYVRQLWESAEAADAREHLLSRGLDEQFLREFRVGYAPSSWDSVLMASRRAGFSERELADAGLVRRGKGGGPYDYFRRRIMFPLCDMRGQVLGFGGRAIGEDQQPKYLNSKDGPVYHKGRHLFGADIARASAAKAGRVILCEGYTDVIAMHQAGLRNAVGLMGTSLTEDQVGELARLAPVVLLALDADSAGQEAMIRAAKVAEGRRIELRVVALPPGSDPADLLREADGAAAMRERVEESVPFVRFQVERELARGDLDGAEGKDAVVGALRPVFGSVPASALRDELLALAADRLGVSAGKLGEWLAAAPRSASERDGTRASGGVSKGAAGDPAAAASSEQRAAPSRTILDPTGRIERAFLVQCIALPSDGRAVLAELDAETELTVPVFRRAAKLLAEHAGEPGLAVFAGDDEELKGVIAELQVRAASARPLRAALDAELLRLQKAALDRELVTVGADDIGAREALANRRQALSREEQRLVAETLAPGGDDLESGA